ncbi:transcriptional repressor scratch 2 isoform X2 [Cryptotermes secundus]|uniref:transcriptional repressor scratch 2 isoform X2 n=1 Tax=Cryptotermes secundus TaxID=105785 RepID=UPI000CD7B26A|nr:transcriptional repressor scratch 2 isoform X2 [Cryptotermes secundus]
MPRAFLITHRRYNTVVEYEQRDSSPERSVSLAEPSPEQGGIAAVCTEGPEGCPPELYNLTQLAEVSLAAAAGHLFSHHVLHSDTARSYGESEAHGCPDCGKRYSTSSNLARHRQTHRSLGDKKARRCPHCDKVYVSMPAFSMHVRTHNQGCKCPYCGKCFSRPWLLQGHIRTHTGEKPFKCSICTKAFADKSNLRAHVQTHSHTKPHVCGRCGKAFALKSYLYKHEESSCMRLHSASTKPLPSPTLSVPLPGRVLGIAITV